MTTQQILDAIHAKNLEIDEILISDEQVVVLLEDGRFVKYLLTDLILVVN
jgi:hypothetical protein